MYGIQDQTGTTGTHLACLYFQSAGGCHPTAVARSSDYHSRLLSSVPTLTNSTRSCLNADCPASLPPSVQAAQARHPITVETCPQYLNFHSEGVPDGSTLLACMPPIRDLENQELLLAAVADGRIDLVASDHSPAPGSMKQLDTGNFMKAWGGISGEGST